MNRHKETRFYRWGVLNDWGDIMIDDNVKYIQDKRGRCLLKK